MGVNLEKYYPTVLFLMNGQVTRVDSVEIDDFDVDETYAVLIMMSDSGLIKLTKSTIFPTGDGKIHLKDHLSDLEREFIEFIRRKETDISKEVNVTEFMVSKFIKPKATSLLTTNDRDFGVYFLKYLKSKDLIKYDEINLSHINYWCTDTGPNPEIKRWFHNSDPPISVELKIQSGVGGCLGVEKSLKNSDLYNKNKQVINPPKQIKSKLSFINNITSGQWQLLIAILMLAIALYWVIRGLNSN